MKLQFEEWILSQRIGETAKELLQEAITCYKASAYRAALLLSYLGFQTIVKERVVSSKCPSAVSESRWKGIQKDLLDDDKWDAAVYDSIQMKAPAPVFLVSDDLRNQVAYWRNRRNDCAHSKSSEIGFAHVESFWLFLRSTLGKFVVSGSKEELLNQIRKHFDYSLTPPGEDFSYIVEQIPYIEKADLQEFFGDTDKIFKTLGLYSSSIYSPEVIAFFVNILSSDKQAVAGELTDYLKNNDELLLPVLRARPTILASFADDPSFIRKLWYEKLFSTPGKDLPLYCSLLRNNMVPRNQIEEANERIIHRYRNEIPNEESFDVLQRNRFFDKFKEIAFVQNAIQSFHWANSNSDIVTFYLDRFGIDDIIVQAISSAFSVKNHPWTLRDELSRYFRGNATKTDEFLAVAERKQIRLPTYLRVFSQLANNAETFEQAGSTNPLSDTSSEDDESLPF